MAPIITPVSAIVGGKINFKLKVRFIHMWSIPEFGNPAEDQFIHMLLLDERVHVHLLYVWLFDIFFLLLNYTVRLTLSIFCSLEKYKLQPKKA
jgi:hypothetical protein